jgi:lipoprotein-anchoring transpeptidase ErfK/SrfK
MNITFVLRFQFLFICGVSSSAMFFSRPETAFCSSELTQCSVKGNSTKLPSPCLPELLNLLVLYNNWLSVSSFYTSPNSPALPTLISSSGSIDQFNPAFLLTFLTKPPFQQAILINMIHGGTTKGDLLKRNPRVPDQKSALKKNEEKNKKQKEEAAKGELPKGEPLKGEPKKILIEKAKRLMTIFAEDETCLKTYKVALGECPVGHKKFGGDMKTPEGTYKIIRKNPHGLRGKTLLISYPNAEDREYARKFKKNPGGDICIHGLKPEVRHLGANHFTLNWTKGCVAVTDEEAVEIYDAVKIGTIVEIRP